MADTPPLRKFMFECSFDGAAAANRPLPERKPVTLKPEQFDALKQESYDAGFTVGRQVSLEQSQKYTQATLESVDRKIEVLINGMKSFYAEQDERMRAITLAIARKILPDYVSTHGLDEIKKVLSDAITEMVHEPRLVVRVQQDQFDAINTYVGELTIKKAFSGQVVVLADNDVMSGDCRVEWADGGLERNTEATWNSIDKIVHPEVTPTSHQE